MITSSDFSSEAAAGAAAAEDAAALRCHNHQLQIRNHKMLLTYQSINIIIAIQVTIKTV